MCEHLVRSGQQDTTRKMRFSHQFCDDIETLSSVITNDIVASLNRDCRDTKVNLKFCYIIIQIN